MLRTVRDRDTWSLQTAVLHLRHTDTGRRVQVMSMIHIGEAAYYTRLNELIAEHDGLILFEGLGQLTDDELASLTPEERKVWDTIAPLTDAYREIARALDLVAQPDALTKPGSTWRRADLPLARLLKLWAERRLPLLPAMGQAGKALESAFFKRTTRLLLLQEPLILGAFRALKGWTPGIGKLSDLLVDERNGAAMAVFDATPADQDILLIYGAGHVPGLVEMLRTRGYREAARDWFTAHSERIAFSDWLDVASEWWKKAAPRPAAAPGRRQ